MKEFLKNVVYAGAGAAFLTKEKIEEVKTELIGKGKMTREEGKQFVDDLVKKSEQAREQFEVWLHARVEEKVKQLNLATADEVSALRRQVAELKSALTARDNERS
ncbi:MAG: hypothetical protein CSA33_00215 [Desulfobulbus propionicus]|nr:MAG: hypothetical protein CSA33_00215 [Desulfobulbus propionicus]